MHRLDAVVRAVAMARTAADAIGATDAASAAIDAARDASEAIGLVDAATRLVDALRDAADALTALTPPPGPWMPLGRPLTP